ncbi:MAG: hypothetical protein J0H41_21010 [Rhizobiales bacterium]|nr:hypothetical protein [Hyphomicrobiales bacterium]
MQRILRLSTLALFCATLAACAAQQAQQADLSPPALGRRDAKAELESGSKPSLRR